MGPVLDPEGDRRRRASAGGATDGRPAPTAGRHVAAVDDAEECRDGFGRELAPQGGDGVERVVRMRNLGVGHRAGSGRTQRTGERAGLGVRNDVIILAVQDEKRRGIAVHPENW